MISTIFVYWDDDTKKYLKVWHISLEVVFIYRVFNNHFLVTKFYLKTISLKLSFFFPHLARLIFFCKSDKNAISIYGTKPVTVYNITVSIHPPTHTEFKLVLKIWHYYPSSLTFSFCWPCRIGDREQAGRKSTACVITQLQFPCRVSGSRERRCWFFIPFLKWQKSIAGTWRRESIS